MSDKKENEDKLFMLSVNDAFFYAVIIVIAVFALYFAWLRIEFMTQKNFNLLNERIDKIEKKIEM